MTELASKQLGLYFHFRIKFSLAKNPI